MNRWIKVLLGVMVFIVITFIAMAVGFSGPVTDREIAERFITANPVDLSQIEAFSQYRSCAGHDHRHPTVQTGTLEKTPRSMKHYISVKPEFRGTVDTVAVFAPFNGKIFNIDNDRSGPGDQQIWLTPDSNNPASPRQWQFIFFHINLDPSLREGLRVTAGQRIGSANLARGPERATGNFDMAMGFTRPMHQPAGDEVFTHMTPQVLDEYAKYGITPENLVITEEYRDAHDCQLSPQAPAGPEYDPGTIYFPPQSGSDEYMFLAR
ncbi:MAG: hypothetical protein O3A36_02385 [bacterium]|nr:hypothetical protein [bacterium]